MKSIIYATSLIFTFSLGYLIGQHKEGNVVQQQPPIEKQSPNQSSHNIKRIADKPAPVNNQMSLQCPQVIDCNTNQSGTQKPALSGLFNQLLEEGNYTEAIDLYSTIYNLSSDESKHLKILFLAHLHTLSKGPHIHIERAIEASDAYLKDFYDDIEVLLIQAYLHSNTDNIYEALNIIQLANSYAITQAALNDVDKAYKYFMKLNNIKYTKNQDWDSLIYIYQLAENTGLLNNHDKLRLTEIYLQLGNISEARDVSGELTETPWTEEVASLFNKYNTPTERKSGTRGSKSNEQYSSTISVIKRNNQFIVPLTLSGEKSQLLLDTGASLTTISEDYYQSISRSANLRYKDTQQFLTANGKAQGSIYNIDKITIGDYTLRNIDIAVLDFPTSNDSNGLLGMNILGQFQFTIDQDNAELKLTPKD